MYLRYDEAPYANCIHSYLYGYFSKNFSKKFNHAVFLAEGSSCVYYRCRFLVMQMSALCSGIDATISFHMSVRKVDYEHVLMRSNLSAYC